MLYSEMCKPENAQYVRKLSLIPSSVVAKAKTVLITAVENVMQLGTRLGMPKITRESHKAKMSFQLTKNAGDAELGSHQASSEIVEITETGLTHRARHVLLNIQIASAIRDSAGTIRVAAELISGRNIVYGYTSMTRCWYFKRIAARCVSRHLRRLRQLITVIRLARSEVYSVVGAMPAWALLSETAS